jgi:hypothetical protein
MEELESMLVSVKAWASKILEALGLCRKDCDALKVENEALKIENAHLVELSKVPVAEPEEKPFDLGPVLVMVGEFKQAIVDTQNRIDAVGERSHQDYERLVALFTELNSKLGSLANLGPAVASAVSQLQSIAPVQVPAELKAFINKVNVDLDYFRSKLNRLPF